MEIRSKYTGLTPSEEAAQRAEIATLKAGGCTDHCASGQVYGGQECTCPGDGTGSPYHIMNPPPGGWPRPLRELPMDYGDALQKLRLAGGMGLLAAAEALGITPCALSAMENGDVAYRLTPEEREANELERRRLAVMNNPAVSWTEKHAQLLAMVKS